MYKKILVPTDGSKLSERAIEHAIALARGVGASLVALHAYPRIPGSPYGTFGPAAELFAEAQASLARADADALFERARAAAEDAAVSLEIVLVEAADVYRQIIAVARKRNCDLICMASHGRHGVSALLLGSETQKVLMHSATPVLVIR
jgi:nucleotide-binding universal stress UspA family protein